MTETPVLAVDPQERKRVGVPDVDEIYLAAVTAPQPGEGSVWPSPAASSSPPSRPALPCPTPKPASRRMGPPSTDLARLVGPRRAMELALTGREMSAQEAFEWGIVNRVVPDEDLAEAPRGLAQRLAAGPTRALRASKRLLCTAAGRRFETQMEHETRAIADISRTADAREGIVAFTEKRTASFEGD